MLKRCQVLLEDWQENFIRNVAERHDQSFSEIIRLFLSEGFLYIVPILHPEYKPRITAKDLIGITKKAGNPNTLIEERHKIISKLYFEARKAAEYRLIKVGVKKT